MMWLFKYVIYQAKRLKEAFHYGPFSVFYVTGCSKRKSAIILHFKSSAFDM